jgi:hypothetical protein
VPETPNDRLEKAHNLAVTLAITEMLRFVLSEVVLRDDPAETRDEIARAVEIISDNIANCRMPPETDEATATYLREAATDFATRTVSSIQA